MNYPDASIEVSKIKSESKKRRCDFKNMDAALAEQSDACQRQNRVPPFIIRLGGWRVMLAMTNF
ncbi:MAG TPA: hypothetical protein DET40_01800 [Lentisphaeria bacterium]|nr:MAG: hypothetical protein A2X45_11620 [Lentisphaerae bacterium GWF2_50_93]HCE42266.1 hypothetical protein [Lentisphaeria bacterium]